MAAHGGERKSDPLVQMAVATTSRAQDVEIVEHVLDTSEKDRSEEAAIMSIASKIQTDDEKNQAVNKMILDEKIQIVKSQFAEQKMIIDPITADIIPEQKALAAAKGKVVPTPKVKMAEIFLGSTVPAVCDLDE